MLVKQVVAECILCGTMTDGLVPGKSKGRGDFAPVGKPGRMHQNQTGPFWESLHTSPPFCDFTGNCNRMNIRPPSMEAENQRVWGESPLSSPSIVGKRVWLLVVGKDST